MTIKQNLNSALSLDWRRSFHILLGEDCDAFGAPETFSRGSQNMTIKQNLNSALSPDWRRDFHISLAEVYDALEPNKNFLGEPKI